MRVFDRSGHRALPDPGRRDPARRGRHLLRAAGSFECLVRRVATGWEAELSIALSALLPLTPLLPLVEAFDRETPARLRLEHRGAGGVWDALVTSRADLAIGAAATGQSVAATRAVPSAIGFVFVCAAASLACSEVPLGEETILAQPARSPSPTARGCWPRAAALLSGQPVLTVLSWRPRSTRIAPGSASADARAPGCARTSPPAGCASVRSSIRRRRHRCISPGAPATADAA